MDWRRSTWGMDGHSFDEIREQFPAEYAARGQICTIPTAAGRELCGLCKRARTTWNELRMKSRGDILVIGHAGWFRTLISGWEKRKKAELLQIPFGYGQVYERRILYLML